LAMAIVGWGTRDALFGRSEASTNYRPATLAEAHSFLSKHGIGMPPDPQKAPVARAAVASVPPKAKPSVPAEPEAKNVGRGTTVAALQAMPPPLPGPIGSALPSATGMEIAPQSRGHSTLGVDLHGLEAKVRTAVTAAGAKVIRVHESTGEDGSITKTLVVSAPSGMANAIASRVRGVGGSHAMVSDPEEEEIDPESESDPVKAAELKAAMDTVATTRAQLVKGEVDFQPSAPALRSMQAMYTEAQKNLAELKSKRHPASRFSIVLTTG
jgi:hypothetical protein